MGHCMGNIDFTLQYHEEQKLLILTMHVKKLYFKFNLKLKQGEITSSHGIIV